jgi:hypothetical protein
VHFNIATRAILFTLLAAVAELQLKLVCFALDQRLDHGVVLAIAPA